MQGSLYISTVKIFGFVYRCLKHLWNSASQVTGFLLRKGKQMLLKVFSDLWVIQVVSIHQDTESHCAAAADSWGKFSEKHCQWVAPPRQAAGPINWQFSNRSEIQNCDCRPSSKLRSPNPSPGGSRIVWPPAEVHRRCAGLGALQTWHGVRCWQAAWWGKAALRSISRAWMLNVHAVWKAKDWRRNTWEVGACQSRRSTSQRHRGTGLPAVSSCRFEGSSNNLSLGHSESNSLPLHCSFPLSCDHMLTACLGSDMVLKVS